MIAQKDVARDALFSTALRISSAPDLPGARTFISFFFAGVLVVCETIKAVWSVPTKYLRVSNSGQSKKRGMLLEEVWGCNSCTCDPVSRVKAPHDTQVTGGCISCRWDQVSATSPMRECRAFIDFAVQWFQEPIRRKLFS